MTIREEIKAVVAILERITSDDGGTNGCKELFCTTCGGMARYLNDVLDTNTRSKIKAILDVAEIGDYYKFGFWKEYIRQSFPNEVSRIIGAWQNKLRKNLDLNDPRSIDYYLIKMRGKFKDRDADQNVILDRSIELSLEKGDASLVESLILVLEEEAINYPELVDLAILKSKEYKPLKRTLYNKLRNVREDVRDYKGEGLTVHPLLW